MSPGPLDREDLRARVQKSLDAFVAERLPVLSQPRAHAIIPPSRRNTLRL